MALDSGGGPRTVAGRYRIERELGRGGMGIVWQALDLDLQRPVAIKEVLLPGHLTDDERADAHARVRREAQTAARVSHPSVITLHDVFDHEGHPWVVMELIRGRSLQEVLASDGPMPAARVAAVAEALLEAVRAAHATGVVHRDIKPGNIMVCERDRVVLTDFGIATMEGGASITRTGALVGSPEFMSPERLQNEQATPASDLWSVGVTLYTALEGRSPFRRDTITAAIAAVLSAPIPPLPPGGPLGPLVAGLLERDPEQRLTADAALALLRDPAAAGGAAAAASGPQAAHPAHSAPSAPSGPQPPASGAPGPNTPHPAGAGTPYPPGSPTPHPSGPHTPPGPNTPRPSAPNTPHPAGADTPRPAGPPTFHPSAPPPAANPPQPSGPNTPFTAHRPAAPPHPHSAPVTPGGPPSHTPTGPATPYPGGPPMPGPAGPGGAPPTGPHASYSSAGPPPHAAPQPGFAPGPHQPSGGPASADGSGKGSRRSAATAGLLVSGGALLLVVVVVGAAVLITRDWTDYTTFRSAWFNVDYPADWGVDDSAVEDEAFVRFTPDDDHLIYVDGWENSDSDPQTSYAWVEADHQAFQEDSKVSDYQAVEMSEIDSGFPSDWDVAYWAAEFSHTDWPTQERYFATHLVTIGAETYAVTLNVPVEEQGDYEDVYDTAVESFEPH